MFQFGRFAHYVRHVFNMPGFPIRKSADRAIFAGPRGLSQLITSFIASESQGIPRIPLFTFFYAYAFCAVRYAFLIGLPGCTLRAVGCRPGPSTFNSQLPTQKSVSIVVCSSFLTSSNMSKNFPVPGRQRPPYLCAPL